jgi:hypothetical protein
MTTTATQSDFVNVQLTAAGVQAAGVNGVIQINAHRLSYKFTPGSTTRVLSSEWTKVLSKQMLQGKAIFELASTTADPQTTLNALEAEEATLKAQIAQAATKGGK